MKKIRRLLSLVAMLGVLASLASCDVAYSDAYPITGEWMLTQFDDCGVMYYYDPYYDGYYLLLSPDGTYDQYLGQYDCGLWSSNEITREITLSSYYGGGLYGTVVRLDDNLIIEYNYPDGYYEVEYYVRR